MSILPCVRAKTLWYRVSVVKSSTVSQNESLRDEFLVLESTWLIFFQSQAFASLLLVGLIVAFAPVNVAFAFKSQNVRGNSVEEPTVVTGDNNAASVVQDLSLIHI